MTQSKYEPNYHIELLRLYNRNIVQACGAKSYRGGDTLDENDVDDVVVDLVNLARRVSCLSACSIVISF